VGDATGAATAVGDTTGASLVAPTVGNGTGAVTVVGGATGAPVVVAEVGDATGVSSTFAEHCKAGPLAVSGTLLLVKVGTITSPKLTEKASHHSDIDPPCISKIDLPSGNSTRYVTDPSASSGSDVTPQPLKGLPSFKRKPPDDGTAFVSAQK
jgi:hypothetical protein